MHLLLNTLLAIFLGLTQCFDYYQETFTSLSVPKSKRLHFGGSIGRLIGYDNSTGCFCRENFGYYSLCYGRESCTAIPRNMTLSSRTFKVSNTHIKELKSGDFDQLEHLVDLQIEGNYELEKISSGAFQNLYRLVNLSIAFNSKLKVLEKDTFLGLNRLQLLLLNNNGFFGSLFDITSTLSPSTLPKLQILVLDANRFGRIKENDFEPMKDSLLQQLSLVLCLLEDIHPLAMVHLKNLRRLHLGENNLNSETLTAMLNNMFEVHIDLEAINFFDMGFKKTIPKALMEVIAKSNISSLNLSKNQFETIDSNSFPLMPNLNLLDLREVLALEVTDEAFLNLPNLKILFLSGNKLSEIPRGVLRLENLTYLDMQNNSPVGDSHHVYFALKEVEFSDMRSLTHLNLGFNGLAHLFNGSFKGLINLRVLQLNNSSIYYIEKDTFSMLQELRFLNLMNNFLIHGDAVPDVFTNLTKLEVLLLSGCRLKYIIAKGGKNPFENLGNLKQLYLDRNFLKTIASADFRPLKALIVIDFAYNSLNSWEERVFPYNEKLTTIVLSKNKISDLTVAMLEDFSQVRSVDLERNAILCKCSVTYKSYQQWYQANHNDIFAEGLIFDPLINCGYPDQLDNITVIDFLTKTEYGEQICRYKTTKILLLLPFICTAAFFTLLCVLAFWYRWHIRYWIFLAKLYLSRKGKIRPNSRHKRSYTNYEYDAFVSYSTEDRDFVIKLITMVETCEPFFKLCVYERDFQIGTIISESVLESVAKSRKTVLVISNNYAKSQWCRWESQICDHHRLFFGGEDGEYVDNSLVLIKLSPVSEAHLTPTLKYLLKTRIYLQWVADKSKEGEFWSKLRNTLGPPFREITHI
ncbi:toll-like receptor 2 [Euwallacea similis]|uniref:toll-like receptor 2 n=1 Tax=Euwallacea similis TaxID=1736056 RepID=UPI00345031A0